MTEHAQRGSTLCWDCKKACGGCPWTEVDAESGRVRFEPVPGWTAVPTKVRFQGEVTGDSWLVLACPLFDPEALARRRAAGRPGAARPVEKMDFQRNVLERYESITAAGKANGVSLKMIQKACRGYVNIVGGFLWRYAEDREAETC